MLELMYIRELITKWYKQIVDSWHWIVVCIIYFAGVVMIAAFLGGYYG